jgi:hypothetical protein
LSGPFRKLTKAFGVVLCLCLLSASRINGQESDALVAKLESADHRVQDVAFSPDGTLLAAGYGFSDEGGVTVWNVADRTIVASLLNGKDGAAGISHVAFSDDGKWLAAASGHGDVMLWAVGSWQSHKTVIKRLKSAREFSSARSLSFSPLSDKLALASDESVVLYDLQTGRADVLAKETGPAVSFVGVSFSPDGKIIATYGAGSIRLWDAETRQPIKTWRAGGGGFFGRLSPDGAHMVVGGGAVYGRKSVEVWDVKDEKKVKELSEFRSGLFSLAISHSGKLFAVAGGDYGGGGDLSLWDLEEGRELGFVSFGSHPIQGVAFSPDDRLLAAASEDGFVLLYSVERLRGPQVKKQASALCAEIKIEDDRTFVVPLAAVPRPMREGFEYAWKLEVANPEALGDVKAGPVVLSEWAIESSAGDDRARIGRFRSLLARGPAPDALSNYAVFGDVMNPGWDKSFVVKVYGDGSFVATKNSGDCLAYGSLAASVSTPDFGTLKRRLVSEGLLAIPKEPLTLGADHYRTSFIGLASDGALELRSDADSIEVLLKGGPAKKREAFSRLYAQEEEFINSLLRAGLKTNESQPE